MNSTSSKDVTYHNFSSSNRSRLFPLRAGTNRTSMYENKIPLPQSPSYDISKARASAVRVALAHKLEEVPQRDVAKMFQDFSKPVAEQNVKEFVEALVFWASAADEARSRRAVEIRKLYEYLHSVQSSGDVPETVVENATRIWSSLNSVLGAHLLVPDASVGPDHEFFYIWDLDEHHMEFEFLEDNCVVAFYRNRRTGLLWERKFRIADTLPEEVEVKLRNFA